MRRYDLAETRQNWIWRMQRFSRCRRTVAAFCDREQVSVSAFYHWRKKLAGLTAGIARQDAPDPGHVACSSQLMARGFVPVQLLQPAVMEIRLMNGVSLSLPMSDLNALRQTLQIVSQFPAEPRSVLEGDRC
jgi:hypothetical protein